MTIDPGDRRTIAREANFWLTKRDAGLLSAQDERDLQAWLDESSAHREAFRHAEAVFDSIAALPALAAAPTPGERPRIGRTRRWATALPGRRAFAAGALAAGVATLTIISLDLPMRLRADAIAPIGESRRVPLPDGSVALLDSGAAISIDYGTTRQVSLLRGQAAFTVAADRAHPFVVDARGGTTTALGTRFIVSIIAPDTRVTVTEHSVRVARDGAARIVPEGAATSYGDGGIARPSPVHVAEVDAWTRGRIRFVNRPLHEVVAELSRYHRGYIGMIGGGLGDLRVNGVFSINDPVGALDIIQRSLGLASYRIGDRVILLHG